MYIAARIFILPDFPACRIIKKAFLPIVLFGSLVCSMIKCYSQTNGDNSHFQIFGQLIGKDTGIVFIRYWDAFNEYHADTTTLDHGRFTFSGTVRRVCEAYIWTNPKNRDMDDQSIIRFILEPGVIHISKIEGVKKSTINGSRAQYEKEKWDSVKSSLIEAQDQRKETAASLRKLERQTGQPLFTNRIDSLYRQVDSIRAICKHLDIGYAAKHPESYLSGYLLWNQCRNISVDSVMLLYAALADTVKNSWLGYMVLKYIYPLTDDQAFRMKYPLVDREFSKQLAGITSIHAFKLKDMNGKMVDFATFRGKYVLIDVWASWCSPCIKNIPAWNELLKQYDPNVIQFVSVSLDQDADAWKKAVKQYNPGGCKLIEPAAFTSLFAVYCKVLWAPTYIIADPAGHIVNYDAPQPVQPELRSLLDNLIKKGTNSIE